jgi:Tfp pilus assembly protein PilV
MKHDTSSGFTTIELLVTLFVATAIVAAFAQIFTVIDRGAAEARWQSTASSLAYSDLRRYDTRPTAFVCDANTNLALNANAPGQTLTSNTYTAPSVGLPGTQATVIVVAYAPSGCAANTPVKLVATTTYGGSPARKVIHATYVY